MGQSAAETVTEIQRTRERIERNLRTLEERMPEPALWAKRIVGTVIGGGVGMTIVMFFMRRARRQRKGSTFAGPGQVFKATIKLEPAD